MKVVIRSSSLLFTLLSIIFQVPIRRTTKSAGIEPDAPAQNNSRDESEPNPKSSSASLRQATLALRGARGSDSFS
jgi:hypothetical protein